MKPSLAEIVGKLNERRFAAEFAATGADAVKRVLELAEGAKVFGTGGSATLSQLGIPAALEKAGLKSSSHGSPEAQVADIYLLSANAVTADGRIVNIDGTCNRVSASLYGPKKVVYVIGRNKIVDGGLDEAITRIKAEACPPNARRLGKKTPCAVSGCTDCTSCDRMCNVTVVFDRKPNHLPVHVVVVDEDLGF